jgi:hypothetical protein
VKQKFPQTRNSDYVISSNQRKEIEEVPHLDKAVNRAEGCNCSE